MTDIHALIITFNEEKHIARCIESIQHECSSITVVDSGSTDRTVTIAKQLGAEVRRNAWVNHATQVNFAIDTLSKRGGWLLRIDADEVLDAGGTTTIEDACARAGDDVDGLLVRRRFYFLGRRIKHGSIEPSWQLRLWRNRKGRCEQRWMDEHIVVGGKVAKTGIVLSDINLNPLTWWTEKHNKYASLEAIETLNARFGFLARNNIHEAEARVSGQAKFKRFVKERIYLNLPPGFRTLFYFLYRYVLRLGFLDGSAGFYFHLLQGLWYRTLVDAKVAEITDYAARENVSIIDAIKNRTGIDPVPKQMHVEADQ